MENLRLGAYQSKTQYLEEKVGSFRRVYGVETKKPCSLLLNTPASGTGYNIQGNRQAGVNHTG